ncbi:MAG: hypothetical protein O7D98_07735 [Candidatus Dadabacteria bacterium]|nr:hypothetical protein [Candidatus Dadabacteria bacterium]
MENTFVGLPVKLGKTGIEEILEIKLTDEESKALHVSASHVKELCEYIEGMGII